MLSRIHNCYDSLTDTEKKIADTVLSSPKDAVKMIEGFGGGMGRMRLTCGAVSGMVMLCGLKYSKGEAKDTETRTLIYETVRKLSAEFEKRNGTIVCRELLGKLASEKEEAKPSDRTEEYYKVRPCARYVADCAKIVEEFLL